MSTATVEIPIHQNVTTFLGTPRKMLIGGRWVEAASGKTFPTYNPATGEVLAQVAEGNSTEIDKAVTAARKAFESGPWRRLTASERGLLIWKLADLVESHLEEFAQLESLDNGKPVGVARVADVPLAVDLFRYMAGWTTKIEGNTIPISVPYTPGAKYLAYTLREPVGVVGQIIPWNFPLLMAAWKLGPALAAGCTIVLKPAEQTPLSALRLGELICEAPGRGQGGLHWLDRSGEAHPWGGREESQESVTGTRRKVPQHRVQGRRPGGEHSRSRERDLFQPRPVLLRRLPALRREGYLRRGGGGRG